MEPFGGHPGDEPGLDRRFLPFVFDGLLWRQALCLSGGGISLAGRARSGAGGTVLPSAGRSCNSLSEPVHSSGSPFHLDSRRDRTDAVVAFPFDHSYWRHPLEHLSSDLRDETAGALVRGAEIFSPGRLCGAGLITGWNCFFRLASTSQTVDMR